MIELRYPIVEDAERYLKILTEGKFENYLATIPENLIEEIKWIERRKSKRDKNQEFNYSILYENTVVGGCEIRRSSKSSKVGELGYFIDKNYQNLGIATQIIKLLEEIAYSQLEIDKLEICMVPTNYASERVAIKNNYTMECLIENAALFKNKFFDNIIYSKLL